MQNERSFSLVSVIALVVAVFVLWAGAQQPPPPPPPPPLLDQADVQALVDLCMSPTGKKLIQPPEPTIDRALFCAAIPLGPALYLAGAVRNMQVLDKVVTNQNTIIANQALFTQQIAQIQADLGAVQAQLIDNTSRITTLEAVPLALQSQIDAINVKLAAVVAALQ